MPRENIVATMTATNNESGVSVSEDVTFEDISRTISSYGDEISETLEESYTITEDYGDFYFIEVKPPIDGEIVLAFDGGHGTARIKPGKYAICVNAYVTEDYKSYEAGDKLPLDGGLLVFRNDDYFVALDNVEAAPVEVLNLTNESKGSMLALQDKETGEFATLQTLVGALYVLASLKVLSDKIGLTVSIEESSLESELKKSLVLPGGKVFPNSMKGKPRKKDIEAVGGSFAVNMGGILAISSENAKTLEAAIAASKTFMQLNDLAMTSGYKYSSNTVCRVKAPMSELLEERGIDPKSDKGKNTAKKLRREIKALGDDIRWTFEDNKGGSITIPLAGGAYGVRNGVAYFTFSSDYMALIASRRADRVLTPKTLLATDEKNFPNSTSLGFKICNHTHQNQGKPNEKTLSVTKLLEYANAIPSYDEVEATDRAYTRRIIKPLERDLNHLIEIGFLEYWDYCHANGEPLTDDEQAARLDDDGNETTLSYEVAITCNIQWELVEKYPEYSAKTAEIRERKRLDAEAAKQRNEEKGKRIERKTETYIAKARAKKELEENELA